MESTTKTQEDTLRLYEQIQALHQQLEVVLQTQSERQKSTLQAQEGIMKLLEVFLTLDRRKNKAQKDRFTDTARRQRVDEA